MIGSETKEEAVNNLKPWFSQRSRWIKGYIQTLIVHMRKPIKLLRELGFIKFLGFLFFIGTPTLVFVTFPIALIISGLVASGVADYLPSQYYYLTMINLIGGYFFHVFIALIIAIRTHKLSLIPYSLIYPLYWLLHPIAAAIAFWEVFFNPYYWRKTEHG